MDQGKKAAFKEKVQAFKKGAMSTAGACVVPAILLGGVVLAGSVIYDIYKKVDGWVEGQKAEFQTKQDLLRSGIVVKFIDDKTVRFTNESERFGVSLACIEKKGEPTKYDLKIDAQNYDTLLKASFLGSEETAKVTSFVEGQEVVTEKPMTVGLACDEKGSVPIKADKIRSVVGQFLSLVPKS